jgi:hypothetical protein
MQSYLKAIEADDRGSLPSSFFYKSFVHQYARTLSLDTKEIDAEIDRVLSADAPLPLPGQDNATSKKAAPVRLSSGSPKSRIYASLAGLILMLAACSGIYGWWHRGQTAPVVTVPVSLPSTPATARPEPLAVAPPQQTAPSGSKVLLDLLAHEATWLSVSSDGKPVFSGILAANQSKTVAGKEYTKMRVGNAAGDRGAIERQAAWPTGSPGASFGRGVHRRQLPNHVAGQGE